MRTSFITLSLALVAQIAFPQAAFADEDAKPATGEATPITVLATGSGLAIDRTGQAITVISAQDIERRQGPDLTRVLEQVPGITISRNGGPGGFTGVRLRGADAEQVLVLIDGVRVEDVSAPSGGFDFGTLTTGGIERIDVLRGSNSVVWGSAAIGGVVAITSKELNGVEGSAEYGARETFTGDAAAGLVRDAYALSLNGGYTRSDGISSAASGTEQDGFHQWRIGGKGRVNLTPELALVATARYADSRVDIDGYPAPTYSFADTPEYQKTRQVSGRAGFAYTGTTVSLAGGFALSDTRRDYYDPTFGTDPSYGYKGRSERIDLTGRIQLPSDFAIDFGGDSEWTRFSSTFDTQQKANLTSGHALLGWYTDKVTLAAGVRVDDHSRFGTNWTVGANGNVELAPGLRLRASYGEGFKAPTLYQLLSPDYGNAGLVPERSRSYDAGLEYASSEGAFRAAVTLFRRDSRNLIAYVSCFGVTSAICTGRPFGTYDNIGKARAEGVEVELGTQISTTVRATASYTYVKSRNLTPGSFNYGNDLARRPRHAVSTSLDWTTPLAGLVLGVDTRLMSDSYDDAGNFIALDGGQVTTLRASLPFGDFLEVYGRVENVFDAKVRTAAGYGTWGRAAFAGVRVRY